jgi:hypothetical protein
MRKIPIILAGLFILSACNNEEKKEGESKVMISDLVAENLKGDVQAVEESPYKTDSTGKPGEMDSCCIDWWEYYIKSASKDSKGTVKEESTSERYPGGLWKNQKTMKGGKLSSSFETQLDDKEQYTGGQLFDSTGKLVYYYTDIKRNEFGQVFAWKQYDKDSVFRQEGDGVYEKNLQMEATTKDSLGKVKSVTKYKYNDKGEQTESTNTSTVKDSTTTKVTKYTYDAHDEQGNWTQRTTWDDKGKATKVLKRTYTYRKKEEAKK